MPCSPGLWAKPEENVTIITVSSYIAHLLKDAPCEVILLGGVYQKKAKVWLAL